jgi:hypothetical protein
MPISQSERRVIAERAANMVRDGVPVSKVLQLHPDRTEAWLRLACRTHGVSMGVGYESHHQRRATARQAAMMVASGVPFDEVLAAYPNRSKQWLLRACGLHRVPVKRRMSRRHAETIRRTCMVIAGIRRGQTLQEIADSLGGSRQSIHSIARIAREVGALEST